MPHFLENKAHFLENKPLIQGKDFDYPQNVREVADQEASGGRIPQSLCLEV